MKIRSITAFAPTTWPLSPEAFAPVGPFAAAARDALGARGIEVQTVRLATPPLSVVLAGHPPAAALAYAQRVEAASAEAGIDYCSLGPVLAAAPDADLTLIEALPDLLGGTSSAFCSVLAAADGATNLAAIARAGEAVRRIGRLHDDGFDNLRFAVGANVPAQVPFFPAAYHDGGPPAFAVALEAADLAVAAFGESGTLAEARQRLVATLEAAGQTVQDVAHALEREHGLAFRGIDLSLAPFPEADRSIAGAIERLGVSAFGGPGTLFAAAFITDTLRGVRLRRCGFSGLMLPVLEDSVLAARNDQGMYSLSSLLLFSAVCGTGLDTIPLPGDATAEQLAAIILDVCALAIALDKPLTARLLPVPGRAAGERTAYEFPYFANSRIMPIDGAGAGGLFRRAQHYVKHEP